MLLPRYALSPGLPELLVFADGSYQRAFSWGAWAYAVNEFGLQGAGAAPGPSVEYFEVFGAISGLEAVLAVDRTSRPIILHSDSAFCLSFLGYASARAPLPRGRATERIRDLYPRAVDLLARRAVRLCKVTHGIAEHRACHRSAAKRLRQELAGGPGIEQQIASGVEEERFQYLLQLRTGLQSRLRALDEVLLALHERLQGDRVPHSDAGRVWKSPAQQSFASAGPPDGVFRHGS